VNSAEGLGKEMELKELGRLAIRVVGEAVVIEAVVITS
jgi:hypothetical protein